MSRLKMTLPVAIFCAFAAIASAADQQSTKTSQPPPAPSVRKIERAGANADHSGKKKNAPPVRQIGANGGPGVQGFGASNNEKVKPVSRNPER
jgi:hypothetical protein